MLYDGMVITQISTKIICIVIINKIFHILII